MKMEDEIKTIDIEIESNQSKTAEVKAEADPIQQLKDKINELEKEKPKERITEIEKNHLIKQAQEEAKRNKLENWLGGRKIVDPEDYDNLKRKASMFNVIKFIVISLFLIALIIVLIWFIIEFKDKDLSGDTFVNNTNNLPATNVQAPINLEVNNTNNPTIQMNLTINIDKVITNSS